jgi:hypothetical protein
MEREEKEMTKTVAEREVTKGEWTSSSLLVLEMIMTGERRFWNDNDVQQLTPDDMIGFVVIAGAVCPIVETNYALIMKPLYIHKKSGDLRQSKTEIAPIMTDVNTRMRNDWYCDLNERITTYNKLAKLTDKPQVEYFTIFKEV